ncbi:hypothetical protein GCM10022420_081070 [Streptomyces iranensis]|uniref:Transposase InsO family protein n=1 Tax=Streptomyces iranensis TaxID=576784 RepID=A0A060ZBP4_9ACTN|nr:transposase InsO family protein [Streptomyces iranensis]CDR01242.1 predicted protein [Streptomyces iranensis]
MLRFRWRCFHRACAYAGLWGPGTDRELGLVTDAIEMAVAARGGQVDGVVFHTDRGAQYVSRVFAEVCRRHGIRRSMGRVGSKPGVHSRG